MANPQLWFLLWEDLETGRYSQLQTDLETLKTTGVSFQKIVDRLNIARQVHQCTYFIHSHSMSAAVQILNDKAIIGTWQLYCKNDPIVTILVRKANDPSPNSSRAPSYGRALDERRALSGSRPVPDLPIIKPPVTVVSDTDAAFGTLVSALPDSEKIVIVSDEGDAEAFALDYVTSWIESQLQEFRPLTEISLQSYDSSGQLKSLQLTPTVWQRSLIRGPQKEHFAPLWQKHTVSTEQRQSTIAQLYTINSNFTKSCKDFIYDMRTFSGNKGSRARLDGTGHEFFLGMPYFNEPTVETILSMPTMHGTLSEQLHALKAKLTEGEMCAAHHLSPIFESAFGISWDKELKGTRSLQHMMSQTAISAEGSKIKKLAHKSSKIFSNAFAKRGGGSGGKGGRGGSAGAPIA